MHPTVHCNPLFKKEQILVIKDLILLENVKLMFRVQTKCAPMTIINLFRIQSHKYSTRRESFVIPLFKLKMGRQSFLSRAITDWDNLDRECKLKENLFTFKKIVKQLILSKY